MLEGESYITREGAFRGPSQACSNRGGRKIKRTERGTIEANQRADEPISSWSYFPLCQPHLQPSLNDGAYSFFYIFYFYFFVSIHLEGPFFCFSGFTVQYSVLSGLFPGQQESKSKPEAARSALLTLLSSASNKKKDLDKAFFYSIACAIDWWDTGTSCFFFQQVGRTTCVVFCQHINP